MKFDWYIFGKILTIICVILAVISDLQRDFISLLLLLIFIFAIGNYMLFSSSYQVSKVRRENLEREVTMTELAKKLEKGDFWSFDMKETYLESVNNMFPELEYKELAYINGNVPDSIREAMRKTYMRAKKDKPKWSFDDYVGFTMLVGIKTIFKFLGEK